MDGSGENAACGSDSKTVEGKKMKEGLRGREGLVGLYVIGEALPRSVARLYPDGIRISVTYLKKEGQIVISTHPKSAYDFGVRKIGSEEENSIVAGIVFFGSAHSAGSERGVVRSWKDAENVFWEISRDPKKYEVIPPKRRGSGDD